MVFSKMSLRARGDWLLVLRESQVLPRQKNEAVEIGVGVWERKATASPLNRRRFQINSGDQFAELLLAEQSGVLGRHGAMNVVCRIDSCVDCEVAGATAADLVSLQLRAMV